MRHRHKTTYTLTFSNASRLRKVFSLSLSLWQWCGIAIAVVALMLALAWLCFAYTPLSRLSPYYMREATRASMTENLLRLDSLTRAFQTDRAYITNILTVLDTDRTPTDSTAMRSNPTRLTVDSLMKRTPEEDRFISMMNEREKYNISILAPLAADGMLFSPVSPESSFTRASERSPRAEIVVAAGSPAYSIADGTVIDVSYSPREGYSVVVQHPKGFTSRLSRLGAPLVERGERVESGQIVALAPGKTGRDTSRLVLEMWRNGDPLIPYELLAGAK